jgi:hypothetical protein
VAIYGNKTVLIIVIIAICRIAFAQQFAVNAYDGDSSQYPRQVKTIFVDLNSKAVISEIIIGQEGQIIDKKPLSIGRNSDTLLITVVMEGCYCDNSVAGNSRAKVSIFNPGDRRLILSYADSNLFIDTFEQLPDHMVFIHAETQEHPRRLMIGDFRLGPDNHFILRNERPEGFSYDVYPGPIRFEYLRPVALGYNLYSYIQGDARYIVRTNAARTLIRDTLLLHGEIIVIDSTRMTRVPDRGHIFAVVDDTLLYDFNQNWEAHTKTMIKEYGQDWIQSCLLIYDVRNFALLDSISIPDYPRGDYVDGAFDAADKIGPFIVYYFFGREGLTQFAPAMLFIFDTRTNEATWLRVGWR